MQNFNFAQPVVIRPVANTENEVKGAALIQCTSYRRQFFDIDGPLNGALGQAFPVLEKYENIECFNGVWTKLAKITTQDKPEGYAYVAYLQTDGVEQPIGMIKNVSWNVGGDLAWQLTTIANVRRLSEVTELGSIYVDPSFQRSGLGRELVATLAKSAKEKGYKTMVTRAYVKNTSPAFFGSTGAKLLGKCDIPYSYDDRILQQTGLNRSQMPKSIPGVWMFWPEQALTDLANSASNCNGLVMVRSDGKPRLTRMMEVKL